MATQLHVSRWGAKLRVKDGLFEVTYLDEKSCLEKQQFAPTQLKSIWLHQPTSLSVAAIELATTHGVDIVFTDKFGHPIGRFHPHRPFSTSKIQKAQSLISIRSERYSFVKNWVSEKLESQYALLVKLKDRREAKTEKLTDEALGSLRKLIVMLEVLNPIEQGMSAKLRGIEGTSGRIFLRALNSLLLPRYQFEKRSSRPAQDAFNAFLNYAFALLYSKVERALVLAGINPYIGFLHRDGYQFKGMVYDFIEPFRTDTVKVVFQLFSREKVNLSQHVEQKEGGIFVTTAGKRMLIEAVQKFYQTKRVEWEGLKITREDWITRRGQQFAAELMEMTLTELPEETEVEAMEIELS